MPEETHATRPSTFGTFSNDSDQDTVQTKAKIIDRVEASRDNLENSNININ